MKMIDNQSTRPKEIVIVPSVLGYELNVKQNFIANYLVPSLINCFLYILHFSCDFTVAYRHIKENNPVWGGLTLFIMHLPAIGCYILIISAWELWPEFDGCGRSNVKWAIIKTIQHLCYPVWSMWRHAERIFWSIEGIRTEDEEDKDKIIGILTSPRTIELYYFLQGYLQAAPQILLQLHILMRNVTYMEQQTVDAQVLSIVTSLGQMAKVTTLYQRFKSQNVGGKYYPWFKSHKYPSDCCDSPQSTRSRIVYRCKPTTQRASAEVQLRQHQKPQSPKLERRRSSDFYELPTSSFMEETLQDDSFQFGRETSVIDGPKRLLLRDDTVHVDVFKPKRLLQIKGLPEDDLMGKTISFLWWICFLIGRMLAISSFAYFYSSEVIWLLSSHFILTITLLLYDVRHDEVRRSKAIFFIFIGFVYLFCLIEFKVKFKKPKFIYNGFFLLVFCENFIMVFVWWFRDIEDILNDWWFKYIFYLIIGCTVLSMLSMLLYIRILKPEKVVVDVVTRP